jgi:GWxTD domain-containing protein
MFSKGHFLILCTLLVSTLLSCNNAYIAEVDRAGDYVYQPGYPELRVVGAGFVDVDTDSSFIELTAEVVYASLVFKNVDGLFRSQIEMDVQVVNQLQPDRIQTSTNTTYTISDSSTYVVNSQDSYQIFKRIAVPPGSYNVRVIVRDASNERESFRRLDIEIPNPAESRSYLTNIQVFAKEGDDGVPFEPVTTYNLSETSDSVRLVFQVTNNRVNEPQAIDTRLLKFESDTMHARPMSWPDYTPASLPYKGIDYGEYEVINSSKRILTDAGTVTIELFFENLTRGNYRFEVRTQVAGEEVFKARDFSIKSPHYPSLKTPRELAAPLIYIMREDDHAKLMAISDPIEQKYAVDRFWLSNIKNTTKALQVIELFYERVEEANKQFSNYKEGWKTDMGMMYVLFGPPWYVQRSLGEEKWAYSHNLYDFETNFIFVAPRIKNKFYPFENYQLVRNQQYFSIQYQQIQKWLNGLILRDNL